MPKKEQRSDDSIALRDLSPTAIPGRGIPCGHRRSESSVSRVYPGAKANRHFSGEALESPFRLVLCGCTAPRQLEDRGDFVREFRYRRSLHPPGERCPVARFRRIVKQVDQLSELSPFSAQVDEAGMFTVCAVAILHVPK